MLQWVSMENEGSKMKVGYEMNGEKIKYHKARETVAKYKPMIQLCNELKWRKEGKMEEKKEGKGRKRKEKPRLLKFVYGAIAQVVTLINLQLMSNVMQSSSINPLSPGHKNQR